MPDDSVKGMPDDSVKGMPDDSVKDDGVRVGQACHALPSFPHFSHFIAHA